MLSATTPTSLLLTCGMLDCGKSTVTTGMLVQEVLLLVIQARTCNALLMSLNGAEIPGSFGPLVVLVVFVIVLNFTTPLQHV